MYQIQNNHLFYSNFPIHQESQKITIKDNNLFKKRILTIIVKIKYKFYQPF